VDDGKASGGWRALSVVLFLALAFACAVMVIAMADIADTPLEKDCIAENASGGTCTEYFDGSSAQKTATLVLGWPSGVLAGIAALVALYFAATGRRGRLLLQLTGAAIALGAISILIGSV
jgi:membrane-associated PAP2 superfamily phosphatase